MLQRKRNLLSAALMSAIAMAAMQAHAQDSTATAGEGTEEATELDRVKTPLLVMHGANDTNVPVVEAEQVVAALKKRGVPVEYVLFPDEGHGWRKQVNRVKSTVELAAFFDKHLN